MPIPVPAGVEVTIDGDFITVKGPKGTLTHTAPAPIVVEAKDGALSITRPTDQPKHRSLHGLTRTMINNMVVGVSQGYKKELDIVGVGYRAAKQGTQLQMNLGYSHQVFVDERDGLTIDVPAPNKIVVSGIDKQAVGQFAAEIRGKRPPEPYKGKGIRYTGEVVRRKEGKAGGKKR